jgi:uncharacterized membrane protein (UPF0127 family)
VTPTARRALNWGLVAVGLVAFGVFLLLGADRPADPSLRDAAVGTTDTSVPDRARVPGFGEIVFRVDTTGVLFGGGGSVSGARCALLASTSQQHGQGLMDRTDLSGYDGMLFRFDTDTDGAFFMRNTIVPLSIAWFDAEGEFVGTADMAPCPDDEPVCPTYGPDRPYRYALEVLQGDLEPLGVGPGTRLLVGKEGC